jgi:hypothetical protein
MNDLPVQMAICVTIVTVVAMAYTMYSRHEKQNCAPIIAEGNKTGEDAKMMAETITGKAPSGIVPGLSIFSLLQGKTY